MAETSTPEAPQLKRSKRRDPIPAVVFLSGSRRGSTERLSGATLRIDPAADAGIQLVAPDESTAPAHHGTLHRAGATYELAVTPGFDVWVNGEHVQNRVLESGDVLEIGRGGTVLRYRLYLTGDQFYKSMQEAFADCIECARREGRSTVGRAAFFLAGITRELATQTTLWFRFGVLAMLAILVLAMVMLTRHSMDLEQRLAREQARVSGLAELLERAEREALDREDLLAMRAELESDLTTTAQRLEALEARSAAIRQVIARAAPSIVFLQGSFGFEDPESQRPLRQLVGPNGQPLRTPQGRLAVTLEGDGPVVEINFTGTAFIADASGLLLTNRHVARPWEKGDAFRGTAELGLVPVARRFIGYLSGIDDPFDVDLLVASERADLAVLRCSDVSTLRPPLVLSTTPAQPGDEVLVMGYPTGIRALLARAGDRFINTLAEQSEVDFWAVAQRLSKSGHISPLASRGIVAQATAEAVAYDAETTQGGSGGPVIDLTGKVVAINTAILPEFGGSNLGVPVGFARELLAQARAARRPSTLGGAR